MNLMTYFWQSNLALLLFYAVYWLFLRRDTFFRWNRFYLLLAVVFALAFPFLPVPTLFQEAVPEDQVLLFLGKETPVYQVDKVETIAHSPTLITWENALLALYALGVLFFFIRLIINIFKIIKLIFPLSCVFTRKAIAQGYFIVQTPPQTPIFSFLNILFWNENSNISEMEKAKILTHELVHIRQWHSLDVLFVEIIAVLFWCNPIIWAYKKSLQSIHEYLADTKVLEKETSKTEYANLLVSQFLQTDTLHLTNSFFNKSLLKNRIMMLYKTESKKIAKLKYSFVVPMLAICLFITAFHQKQKNLSNKVIEKNQKISTSMDSLNMQTATAYFFYQSIENKEPNFAGIFRNDLAKELFELTMPCEEDLRFSDTYLKENKDKVGSHFDVTSIRKIYFRTINLTVTKQTDGKKYQFNNIKWQEIENHSEKGDEIFFTFNDAQARNSKSEWVSLGKLCPSFGMLVK